MIAVIHFFTDVEVAEKDLPLLLDGKKPNTASAAGVGSGDYSRSAEAVRIFSFAPPLPSNQFPASAKPHHPHPNHNSLTPRKGSTRSIFHKLHGLFFA